MKDIFPDNEISIVKALDHIPVQNTQVNYHF